MNQLNLAAVLAVIELVMVLFGLITLKLDWRGISKVLALLGAASALIAFVARVGSGWSPSSDTVFGGLWINAIAMFALAAFLFIVDVASECGLSPRTEAVLDKFSNLLAPLYRLSRH